jgi:hypothetical protein
MNPERDKAASNLEGLLERKQAIDERALRRFQQGLSPLYTFDMTCDLCDLDKMIGRAIADIRAANYAETCMEAEG